MSVVTKELGDEIVHHMIKQECGQVALGSILGDGYLTPLTKRAESSRLWLKYSDKTFAYLEWMRKKLAPFGVGEIKEKKGYRQHYFLTSQSDFLGVLRKWFYSDGHTKNIPENIKELFVHPISLAVWYMDDGTLDLRRKYHWNPMMSTYCFSFDDHVRLTEVLAENFGIRSSVTRCTMRGKLYYRLYIVSESVSRFMSIVKPYIHSCFRYKVQRGRQQ